MGVPNLKKIMPRLYSFTNKYLSDIQRGIQTAHLVSQFTNKYLLGTESKTDASSQVVSWSLICKDIIVFNGGNSEQLGITLELFRNPRNKYPFAVFRESDESLNGALTAVGIILPDLFKSKEDRNYMITKISSGDSYLPEDIMDGQLAELLNKSRLA